MSHSIHSQLRSDGAASAAWHLPHLTFTQGLLVGQLSIILVVVALIRYLLFEDAPHNTSEDDDDGDVGQSIDQKSSRRSFPLSSPSGPSSRHSLLSLSLSSAPFSRAKAPPPTFFSDDFAQPHGSGPTSAALARIPEVVGYDMETATDIDVGWLNVLLAHVWEGYRDDFLAGGSNHPVSDEGVEVAENHSGCNDEDQLEKEQQDHWHDEDEEQDGLNGKSPQSTARDLIQDIINRPKKEGGKLEFLDEIQVTECLVGNSYPILSNARVRPRDDQGRVRIELDVDYTDLLSLSLQTALLINYPRPRFGVLPLSLGIRITRFSGTISLSFDSSPPGMTAANKRSRHSLSLSLHPDFLLKATCSSLVGARAKLQDIPKIQQLILQRIRAAIGEKLGWPRTFDVEMPDLIKRRRARRPRRRRQTNDCCQHGCCQKTGQDGSFERRADSPQDLTESTRMGGIAEEDETLLKAGPSILQEDAYMPNGPYEALDPQLALQARRRRAKAKVQAEVAAAREELKRQTIEDLQQTPKSRSAEARGGLQRNGKECIPPAMFETPKGHSHSHGISLTQPHFDVNGGRYHDPIATIRQRKAPPLANVNLNGNGNGVGGGGTGGGGSHYTSISRRPPNPRYSSTPDPNYSASSAHLKSGSIGVMGASKEQRRTGLARAHSVKGSRVNGEEERNVGRDGGRIPTVRDWLQRSNGEL